MKVINRTKNTLYIEDIDLYIPFNGEEPEYLSPDKLKKSRGLRNSILNGSLEVVEYNKDERIENSLVYLLNKVASKKSETVKPETNEIEFAPPPSLSSGNNAIEVKIHGIFYDASGYGKVNRNLALKLKESGYTVKVDPKRSQNQLKEEEIKDIVGMEKIKLSKNHICIDSIIPSFSEMSTGKYRILYTTIESYTVPKQFLECCTAYSEIWLTSEWSASILRQHIKDKPIYTVITGVDTELYTPEGPRFDFKPKIKDFVFVSVFGWNYRKGYDVLLKAYFDEFSAQDNVSLLIMSRYQSGMTRHHRMKIKSDIDKIMEGFPNKDMPHVVRYGQLLAEKDMPKLYRACDAFVLPTRGEGGGLPPLEASLCGLPIIMTNCSGQQGYLRPNNSYMLEIDRLAKIEPGQMHLHYWDGQEFPALTSPKVHKQLRRIMRNVFEDRKESAYKVQQMQKFIFENFTWTHTANAAVERIEAIAAQLKG